MYFSHAVWSLILLGWGLCKRWRPQLSLTKIYLVSFYCRQIRKSLHWIYHNYVLLYRCWFGLGCHVSVHIPDMCTWVFFYFTRKVFQRSVKVLLDSVILFCMKELFSLNQTFTTPACCTSFCCGRGRLSYTNRLRLTTGEYPGSYWLTSEV